MTVGKKDISAFTILVIITISTIIFFYKNMSDVKFVATVNPYSLIVPTPQAVLAINRPLVFERIILPMDTIRQVLEEHISPIFLSLIRENSDLPSFLIAFYQQGDILYAPMDNYMADRLFKQLDTTFLYSAQKRDEASIPMRYYPDTEKRFLGCYYHDGIFVASYNRKLLVEVAESQQAPTTTRVLPDLNEALKKMGRNATLNLFVPSGPLDLHVQINDTTEWRIQDQWLALDLFFSEGNLCCFNEQPYEQGLDSLFKDMSFPYFSIWNNTTFRLDNLYQSMGDTVNARVNQLFPQIKTTAQVSHDEAVAYFTICGD